MTKNITIATADGGAMPAEIATPAEGSGKAIIIVPPIFGVEDGTRDIMEDYAAKGSVVVTPDMFWRTIPGTMGREGEDRAKADERSQNFDVEQGVKDLADVVAFVRAMPQCNGKVAVFGAGLFSGWELKDMVDTEDAMASDRFGIAVATENERRIWK